MKRVFRGVLFCPLNRGKSGAAGKGEASAASQSAECFSCHMTLKVNPVTLTLIICGEAATTTLGAKGPVKLTNPPALRPVHLKNLSL